MHDDKCTYFFQQLAHYCYNNNHLFQEHDCPLSYYHHIYKDGLHLNDNTAATFTVLYTDDFISDDNCKLNNYNTIFRIGLSAIF